MEDIPYYNQREVSQILGVSLGILRSWRQRKYGPKGYRLSHKVVVYKKEDVKRFMAEKEI